MLAVAATYLAVRSAAMSAELDRVIAATSLPVFAAAVLLWVVQRRGGSAKFSAGSVSAEFTAAELVPELRAIRQLAGLAAGAAREAAQEAKQANQAVNHAGPDEPPLVQRVATLELLGRWTVEALSTFATRLGFDLPPCPVDQETPPDE